MNRIELPDPRVRVEGVAWTDDTPGALRPHRIGRSWTYQLAVETLFVEGMPSGGRMVLATDATSLAIECTPMRLTVGLDERPATFDLVVGDERLASVDADFGHRVVVDIADESTEFTAGEAGTVEFDGLPADLVTVEIWLPHAAGVTLHAIEVPDGCRVEAAPTSERPRWIHHGSSISHCMEADGPTRTWPAVAASATGHDLVGLGFAGQCHVDQFAARTIRDLPADRISLKLGINVANADSMNARTFPSAVHGFLDTVREGHPDTPILVISPIICPALETTPGPSRLGDDGRITASGNAADLFFGRLTLERMRELLSEIVEARRALGDERLTYLDGRELFGEDDVDDLPDGLHPNAAGYVRMGERFARHPFLSD